MVGQHHRNLQISLTEGENYVEGIYRHASMKGIEEKMNDVIDQIIYKETMIIDRHDKEKENGNV